jgi:dipeptidyl aminopeptidase/acylaminoacyl peptidase
MKQIHPYGQWPSPVTAEMLTQQSAKISEIRACDDSVFWLESRPSEKGRNALVQLSPAGTLSDVLPAPHSIRTRAHEYGGSSYLVTAERIFCVLDADQRIYSIDRNTQVLTPLSPEWLSVSETQFRYADFSWDETRKRLICVREDHSQADHAKKIEERSEIVAIDLSGNVNVLVSGADFYSNPRLNPAGDKLSYLCWNHPQMPWDGTECYCADLNSAGEIINTQLIAGSKTESVFQPQWSPAGELFFVSDRNNWWNLYRHTDIGSEIMCDMPAEFATPQWVFGMSTYGFLNAQNIFCCFSQNGQWQLGLIDIAPKTLKVIKSEFNDIAGIHCHNEHAYFFAASTTQPNTLYHFYQQEIKPLIAASKSVLTQDDIAQPQPISFVTSDNETAHGFYYAPKNKLVVAPENTLPPLIVMCHGGPTGATETSLNLKIQFWTSRGFAVLDVNYRGSTGYGRHYRDRLKNNWGITDVIDVCSGANYLIEHGLVDKNKIAIRGSSAGGYTVLAALTFSDTFKAGASLYGIGDLEALAKDTHKFEARYLDSLVGEYPKEKATYHARSPIHHIDQLNCPVIFLQGLKDKVVPPTQAEAMVAALTKKGIKNAYVTFAEEGHGFRQAETIEKAIHAEFMFYRDVFQIQP